MKLYGGGDRAELTRCGGQAASNVVGDVRSKEFLELTGDGARRASDFVARDFAYTDDVAIGGGDEDFVGGVKIFGTQCALRDADAGFRSDLEKDAPGDAFEAAGVERRSINLAVFNGKNIGGGALGDFAAFVEQNHFVEAFFLRFRDGPDVGKPGDAFYASEGRGGVAAVRAQAEAHRLAIFGQRRGINDEVHLRLLFLAAPKTDLVVNKIDARAAFGDVVGTNNFVQMHANLGGGVRHGQADQGGIFFEAAPMALVSKSLAARDADRGEQAPTADQPRLPGGKANFLDRQQRVVMKNVAMDQCALLTVSILAKIERERGRFEWAG